MKRFLSAFLICLSIITLSAQDFTNEIKEQKDARMEWWREARFGLFIHWGLYAVPAGEWNGKTIYGEWIRSSAEIPIDVYDKFTGQFNPVKFNADEWVRTAKNAGMKYIVITSKHHDGFCLFDSKFTDFDVMSTPFKRDILKELSEACAKEGIKMCFYHSIMDWHHPDYMPRRDWEKNRTSEGADFNRYVEYMKNQLRELETKYGPLGVLWFDGEWESTWTYEYGKDVYNLVRGLQPDIIVNNRVSPARSGMEGLSAGEGFAGDFGTPEQQIPATGLPGVDWETCMTMNDHWGFNKADTNWKSTKDLLRMLADIASKGGNYLLNVGPTSEGLFPQESIDRLTAIGEWMKVNGESIYGTDASPFKKLDWGRCTQRNIEGGTRLYLHVFEWPMNGKLIVPGIYNEITSAFLLSDVNQSSLTAARHEDAIEISVPLKTPDEINSVIVLDLIGKPDINNPPEFVSESKIFIDELDIKLMTNRENTEIRFTHDGSEPTIKSGLFKGSVKIKNTSTLSARCFRNGRAVSGTAISVFTKVEPQSAVAVDNPSNGIRYKYFEGDWDLLPRYDSLKAVDEGILQNISLASKKSPERFGFEFSGYVKIPADGVYIFSTASDDGSQLFIDGKLTVDNDGLHGLTLKEGTVALQAGYHPLRVTFFEKTGSDEIRVFIKGPGIVQHEIPESMLFYEN